MLRGGGRNMYKINEKWPLPQRKILAIWRDGRHFLKFFNSPFYFSVTFCDKSSFQHGRPSKYYSPFIFLEPTTVPATIQAPNKYWIKYKKLRATWEEVIKGSGEGVAWIMNRHLPVRQRTFQPEGLQSTGGSWPQNLKGKAVHPFGHQQAKQLARESRSS